MKYRLIEEELYQSMLRHFYKLSYGQIAEIVKAFERLPERELDHQEPKITVVEPDKA